MKNINTKICGILILLTSIITACVIFSGFKVSNMSRLDEFAHSYAGVYECKYMSLGEKSLLDDYKYINLELKTDGTYVLSYADKRGRINKSEGEYSYDGERDEITVHEKLLSRFNANTFSVTDGVICVSQSYGRRVFIARFEMT